MIIDTSNAPCGPGFLPGLRLSEGRFVINRECLTSGPDTSAAGASQALAAFVLLSADRERPGHVHCPSLSPLPTEGACGGEPVRPRPSGVAPLQALRRGRLAGSVSVGHGCRWTRVFQLTVSRPCAVLRLVLVGGQMQRRVRGLVRRPTRSEPPAPRGRSRTTSTFRLRPQIRRDNPLNLSILLSGGKETNQDSLSSGERRGKSPAPNPRPTGGRGKCGVQMTACPVSLGGLSPSDRGSARGRCEAGNGPRRAGVRSSRSRVVWECSPKRVVNSI